MSVITHHEIKGNNIFDRLVAEGIIHAGDIYSPHRHMYMHFNEIFDYTKCDAKTCAELDAREKKRTDDFEDEVNSNPFLSDAEKVYRIDENRKCDYHLLPVRRTDDGGVAWTLNYWSDDWPTFAVGRKYPDEIFDYRQTTEGHLDVSLKFKGDNSVTEDGKAYDTVLHKISNKLIHKVDSKTYFAYLFLDKTDQSPAKFYFPKKNICPTDYDNPLMYNHGYSEIVIRDKNVPLTIYRHLKDGSRVKEQWPVEKVQKAIYRSKQAYQQHLTSSKKP